MIKRTALAATLVSTFSINAQAELAKPASIDIGGFDFTPQLNLTQSYDDNFRTLPDHKQASWISSVAPIFLLQAETRNTGYQLQYIGNNQTYWDDSSANHTDHQLTFRSVLEFDSRNRLRYDLGYKQLEQTTDTTVRTENDRYTVKNAGIGYTFGAATAKNQIDLGLDYEQRRFQNADGINDDMERNTTAFIGTWYHRLSGKTRALGEVRYTDFDYLQSGNPRTSVGTAALVGLEWDATAKTTGKVRIGEEQKDFNDSDRNDRSPTWEVGIDYKPRTYSTFSLNTHKSYDEGDDGASAIHVVTSKLGWEHHWSQRIKTTFDYTHAELEYEGVDRQDKQNIFGSKITYGPRRWVDVSLGYLRIKNDSTAELEGFTRNIYLLSVELSL
ncbi:outer membrane beta-barrel protein [Pseudomonas sp. MWU16-30317]|uniref:outer membrane beta-barrel protein n=1 Tax=Pseudomonas sp. MWU16-30317 TaxID=2878095 RepID=UPI001CFA4AE9|nr:outer membrane beta-barrel protein [Pseudomonas sp. MWU16-30317]